MLTISTVFRVRGSAGGIAGAIGFLFMFAIVKTLRNVISWVGMSGAYFLYGGTGVLGFIYLYFQLPETEGIPLEAIEGFFNDDKKKVNGQTQGGTRVDRNNTNH